MRRASSRVLFCRIGVMLMGAYKYLKAAEKAMQPDVQKWSRQPVIKRLKAPSKLARAHSLGYKAKQGFVVVRVRIKKGSRRRPSPRKGRKPRSAGVFFTPVSRRAIAERRVARRFPNMEVLNSYYAGDSGTHSFFEVILVDALRTGMHLQKRRAFRGLTSAGRKGRGLGR